MADKLWTHYDMYNCFKLQNIFCSLQLLVLPIWHTILTPGGPGGPRNPGGPDGPSSPGSPFIPDLPGKPSSPS